MVDGEPAAVLGRNAEAGGYQIQQTALDRGDGTSALLLWECGD